MSKNLKDIALTWEEKYRYGSIEERKIRASLWKPYYSMIYKAQENVKYQVPTKLDELIQKLCDKGAITEDSKVLDIGCGLGGHTFQISKVARKVVSLDTNEVALSILNKRAKENGVKNVTVVNTSWEDYQSTDKFDLVFSSMCPAICNIDEIKKMESLSKGSCALITVMAGSYDKHRKAMMGELNLKPEGMITDFDTYKEVLTAMGRKIQTDSKTTKHEYKTYLEDLLETMPTYFKIFGIDEETSVSFIKDYFDKNQEDGHLNDETLMNIGLIYWKPSRNA